MNTIEEKATDYTDSTDTRVFGCEETLDATKLIQQGYIAGATEALAGQWRSVDDELPKPEQDVFVAVAWGDNYSYGYAWLSTLSNGTLRWYSHDDYLHLDDIRYWMPIPELPKNESK